MTNTKLSRVGFIIALHATCFYSGFLLGLFSDSEDGSDMFHCNVGLRSVDYTGLYPRRQCSLFSYVSYNCNFVDKCLSNLLCFLCYITETPLEL
jgi:hypothetical protein